MGKIANALNKYAQEKKVAHLPEPTEADLDVLLSHGREAKHLLNYDDESGQVNSQSIEVLKNKGTIQRLLSNNLIFPGGKLTSKGLRECERLQQTRLRSESAVPDRAKVGLKCEDKTKLADDEEPFEKEFPALPPHPSQAQEPPPAGETRLREEPDSAVQPSKWKPPPYRQPATTDARAVRPSRMENSLAEQLVQIEETFKKDDQRLASEPKPSDKKETKYQPIETGAGPVSNKETLDLNLVSLLAHDSYEAEQFKILRTNILFPVAGEAPQSILVTSAMPAEGKSFVAANLAISIALNINKHVLLVDCDLRNPSIHQMFGFGEETGLSDYLTNNRDLPGLLLKTSVDKLTLLPAGPVPSNPSELMSSERMSALLKEVKCRYPDRLIVVDSPPLALAAETAFLARHIDGVIFVVKYGNTPRHEFENMMETVGTKKIIGCVINQKNLKASEYRTYKKGGRYGKWYGK